MALKIGILGNGQLGRMLAIAGQRLNEISYCNAISNQTDNSNTYNTNTDHKYNGTYVDSTIFPLQFAFYDKSPSKTTEGLGIFYDDISAFLNYVDVVTYENENIPLELANKVITWPKPLYPGLASLEYSQHRLKEKALFDTLDIPTVKYRAIRNKNELLAAVVDLSFPFVLKTVTEGYDGKGQTIFRNAEELEKVNLESFDVSYSDAYSSDAHSSDAHSNDAHSNDAHSNEIYSNNASYIAEQYIHYTRELSIIAVRDKQQNIVFYPMVENHHHQGILRKSLAPANIDLSLEAQAKAYVTRLLHHLDHVGVFTLELFETAEGQLLANECAPRVHNSGHWTIEACECSQFENHIRAIAGLPLGESKLNSKNIQDKDVNANTPLHAGMINLLGEIPADLIRQVSELPSAYLHDYLKAPRPQRKLGHVTVVSKNAESRDKYTTKVELLTVVSKKG